MNWAWVSQADLQVRQGVFYRFVILAPSDLTQDAVYNYLASTRGWDIKSVSAPPASVTAVLQSVIAQFPAASPPTAYWIEATWTAGDALLPQPDGSMYYEALQYYEQVPALPPSGQPLTESPWASILIGGAVVLGSYLLLRSAPHSIPYASHPRRIENPHVQTIKVNVNGRPVTFDVDTDGMLWTATADIRAGKRKRVVGSGGSKSEALQQAVSLASRAFAQADVRV